MGLPAIIDLLITTGAEWSSTWTYGNQAGPFNLSGWRLALFIGLTPDVFSTLQYTLDSAANNGTLTIVTANNQSQFTFFISAAASAIFSWANPAFFKLFAYPPSNPSNPLCLWAGNVYLDPYGVA